MNQGDASEARTESSLEHLAAEWDKLADRTEAPPHLRPGWFSAWWHAFGTGELMLFTVRRGGRLAGVLPMGRHRGHLYGLANYHTPSFGPVAEDPDAAHDLVAQAIGARPRRLSMALVDEDDPALPGGRAIAAASGYRVLERVQMRTPFVTLDGDWDSHLARMSRHFRKELRRQRRRLEELGEVRFEVSSGAGGLEHELEEVLAVEASGWKAERGTAIASRPETKGFYTEVATWAAARGMLRLLFLRLDGRPVAVDYALQHGRVRYMLKGGFDTAYARMAPGTLLLADGLAEAIGSGLERVELGGGDDKYKLRWTATVRTRTLLQAFAPSALGLVDRAMFAYGRPLAKRWRNRLPGGRGREEAG